MTAIIAKFDGSDLVAGSAAVNTTLYPIRADDKLVSYNVGSDVVIIKVIP